MKTITVLFTTFLFLALCNTMMAQPSGQPDGGGGGGGGGEMPMGNQPAQEDIMSGLGNPDLVLWADVNNMNDNNVRLLNAKADSYEGNGNRGLAADFLSGGVSAIVEVIGEEIINLAKIRSKQKQTWEQMRQKECTFVDSLQSINGQSDFYGKPSNIGPLDPRDMKFDGITLSAQREGKEVFTMVCHIDTSRVDHLFLHSKFYLVADTIVFYPYRSFLPNLSANGLRQPSTNKTTKKKKKGDMGEQSGMGKQQSQAEKSKKEKEMEEYWETISQFKFGDNGGLTVNVGIDIYSSWINELVQVYKDVKLGSFSMQIPISKGDLKADAEGDSVYIYIRNENKGKPISVDGECFVVPRSYMPGSANNPSWGTGEYKMKIAVSEKCQYDPNDDRARKWHKDYKQLMRLKNNGKAKNEYWQSIKTTSRESRSTLFKAVYSSATQVATDKMGLSSGGGGGGQGGGMPGGKP